MTSPRIAHRGRLFPPFRHSTVAESVVQRTAGFSSLFPTPPSFRLTPLQTAPGGSFELRDASLVVESRNSERNQVKLV